MIQRTSYSLLIIFVSCCVLGCNGMGSHDALMFSGASAELSSNFRPDSNDDSGEPSSTVRAQSPANYQTQGSYPIDFPTVLQLAGADNWNVKIARARAEEASANYCEAKNQWLPSLTLSMGYNKHEGEIQGTEGDVLTVSRNSLFMGGGAGIANSPLNGGSGGPPRMFVDFSLADAIFQPLAARQKLGAEQANQNRVFNDTMLEASLAYYELVGAQSRVAIAEANLFEAQQLATLTSAFVESGKGTVADNRRVAVIVNNRKAEYANSISESKIASAQLATILQLDPSKLNPDQGLMALDIDPVPLNLIPANFDLNSTIQQAQTLRCEIAEANARVGSAESELQAEQWRPWLPNLYLGYSGGVFGGGQGGDIPNLDGRSDLDVVVSWQVKNLGFGTRARQDQNRSRTYQRKYEMRQIRDQIAEQVVTTHQRVDQYRTLVSLQNENVAQAGDGLEKNLASIKGLEGLPLEAIASLEQLAKSRNEYVTAVINFNQWQVRLLRAAGQSLSYDAELGQSSTCNAYTNGCDAILPQCSRCISRPDGRPVGACDCNDVQSCDCQGGRFTRVASVLRGRSSCGSGSCGDSIGSCGCSAGVLADRPIGTSYLSPAGSMAWWETGSSNAITVADVGLLQKAAKNRLIR